MVGSAPGEREQGALLRKHPNLEAALPALADALRAKEMIFYTQWEAWLALFHGKLLLTAEAESLAPRDKKYAPTEESRAAQATHLRRLNSERRYPGCKFASPDDLAKHIAYTAILDLLVKDYAKEEARARVVAEGFIREMAGKVAADQSLDFEGMKRAVRNAIEIYREEIGRTQTNLGVIVDRALANAKRLLDEGKARSARATLRQAADQLRVKEEARRREEQERRTQYAESVTTLYGRERDFALAAYGGEAAADAVVVMAQALHGNDIRPHRELLIAEGNKLEEFGDQRGSNVHLVAAIAVRRATLRLAATPDEIGSDQINLGNALCRLGDRESGTARLEEAVVAYRDALKERTRDRAPLDWATTQMNLGTALQTLGARESGVVGGEEPYRIRRHIFGMEKARFGALLFCG
jgi:hypothetical protein